MPCERGAALSLSGSWSGFYSYDRAVVSPVPFSTVLEDSDPWITGTVEEIAVRGPARGRTIAATLQGRRRGRDVVWLKVYEDGVPYYDAVNYAGEVNEDATEIEGRWTVSSSWSGTFLMVRDRKQTAVARLAASLRV